MSNWYGQLKLAYDIFRHTKRIWDRFSYWRQFFIVAGFIFGAVGVCLFAVFFLVTPYLPSDHEQGIVPLFAIPLFFLKDPLNQLNEKIVNERKYVTRRCRKCNRYDSGNRDTEESKRGWLSVKELCVYCSSGSFEYFKNVGDRYLIVRLKKENGKYKIVWSKKNPKWVNNPYWTVYDSELKKVRGYS